MARVFVLSVRNCGAAPPSHPMPQPRPTNLFSRQQPAKYSIGLHQHKGKRSDAPEQEATGTHQATRKFLGLCSRLRLVNAIATSPCLSHTRGTPRAQQIAAGSSSHCRGRLDRRTKAPINEGTSYEARDRANAEGPPGQPHWLLLRAQEHGATGRPSKPTKCLKHQNGR